MDSKRKGKSVGFIFFIGHVDVMFSLLVLEIRGVRPSINVSQVQMLDAASYMG